MSHQQNRRRHTRYSTQDLAGTLYVSSDARIVNMSLTGLAIECSSHLKPGNRYTIELPDDNGRLRLPAEVQWCHLEGTRRIQSGEAIPVYQAGLCFEEVLSNKAHEILGVLKEHVTIELERRLFGRFQLREDQSARLARDHQLAVQSLSFSGMLVLSTLEPRVNDLVDLELPFELDQLELSGRVAYSKSISAPVDSFVAEVGIEFTDLDAQASKRLRELLVTQIQ